MKNSDVIASSNKSHITSEEFSVRIFNPLLSIVLYIIVGK